MSLRDAGVTIIAALAILAAIGIATRYITKTPDGPVEEAMEEQIEDMIEGHFGLPDGSLHIDLSPGTDEH